jgi:iron complex outermembrane receptor protein
MKKVCIRFLPALMAMCVFIGTTAIAEEYDDADEFMLEEIIVTAQKRDENQQKVGIAMEVVTGEDLVATGKNDIDEILSDMANVEINQSATGMRVSIRGLTDDSATSNNMDTQGSMVAINVDGAYNGSSSAGLGLFDVERVEVLMGPQSTMYGSNSPGGIVNVVTAAPKTDKYSGSASIEVGSYDLLTIQGALNVPLIQDALAMRLAVSNSNQGSWTDDGDSKTTAVRLKTLWDVNEDLDITVTGNWSTKNGGGLMGGEVVPFINQDDADDPWTSSSDSSDSLANKDDQVSDGVSAEINWSTPYGNVTIVPSYTESNSEGDHTTTEENFMTGTSSTVTYSEEQVNEQTGAEIRMTNAESFEWFDWIFGATYYDSFQRYFKDYAGGTASDTGREIYTKKKAIYANITYPTWFNEKLKLTLGYRQSWDSNNGWEYGGRAGVEGDSEGDGETYSKPDMKYGFEYDAADNMMVYGSYASSFRSSNAVAQTLSDGSYPPNEEMDSYTLGLKSRWFNNRLQLNLAAYYYDYSNKLASGYKDGYFTEYEVYQGEDVISAQAEEDAQGQWNGYEEEEDGYERTLDIYDYDEDGSTDDELVFHLTDTNAQGWGEFSTLGLDLSATWLITSKDQLNFSVSYLKSEWETLHFEYYYSQVFDDEDYSGVTPENSPEWSMTGSYKHTFTLGSLGTLTPRLDGKYKSEYYMVGQWKDYLDNYVYVEQEAYTMWDASVSYQHSSGVWSLNAYVNNITNYAVKSSVQLDDNSMTMRLEDPRTYGATFSIKF